MTTKTVPRSRQHRWQRGRDIEGGPRDVRYLHSRMHDGDKLPVDLGTRAHWPKHSASHADANTAILPRVGTLCGTADLDGAGVRVTAAQVEREQCQWCGMTGHVTTVRVYGDPAAVGQMDHPLTLALTCRCCAPAAIKQARVEQDFNSDKDIRVEICE
jgi:hypothetical protein